MFKQAIKNFGIHFNTLNEEHTFSAGDVVSGHVTFDLAKETNVDHISMEATGQARTRWSAGGGKKRRKRVFSAKVDYFCLKSVLLQKDGGVHGAMKLQPGTHVYPFTFRLPQGDFPTSFHGLNGAIEYTLKVAISRPWHMSKNFVTEFKFVRHIDINQPGMQAPLSGSNETTVCSLWCTSSPLTMTVSIEKKAFIPGETVQITCEFSNGTGRAATPKAKLQQKQEFFTHNKVHRRVVGKHLDSVTGRPVGAHTSDVHVMMALTIPPLAPLTISNCSILTVAYFIEVSFGVFASPDLTVLCPIILHHNPAHTLPPH